MRFEQNFRKTYFLIQFTKQPVQTANSNFAKRQNLQCDLLSIWMNASNEEEVSESFSFTLYI